VLWTAALPPSTSPRALVNQRGLRWLTCSAEKRTKPRLQACAAAGVPAEAMLPKMRQTDAQFEDWLNRERAERAILKAGGGAAPPPGGPVKVAGRKLTRTASKSKA